MSSDLLQQAMVDARALKEAAMKNAENALIEKYSQEFNQAVQRLLEQEEVAAPPQAEQPVSMDPMAVDPMADMASLDTPSLEQEKAFNKVPSSFDGSDEEEMITINFDQLKSTLNEMLGIKIKNEANDGGGDQEQPASGDALDIGSEGDPTLTVKVVGSKDSMSSDDELELELEDGMGGSDDITSDLGTVELEEVELDEQNPAMVDPAVIAAQEKVGKAKSDTARAEGDLAMRSAQAAKKDLEAKKAAALSAQAGMSLEEELELTEEELQDLAEELKVDLNIGNLSDGYMGSTETQKREQRNTELAAARDQKASEEREEEKEKMADLMKENKQLKNLNDESYKVVVSLKEQLKKTNLLNAKLLYTNKALANVSLNERQKQNIVESISKVDSVLAAKTIYETAESAVENMSKTNEAPQTLRETLNRSATPFAVKKAVYSDPMAERLKALAGIKKQQ